MLSEFLTLRVPDWLSAHLPSDEHRFESDDARMQFVISLARANVDHGTGGPFGAAIFESATGRLVAPGVNLVTYLGSSVLHAEIVAFLMAQKAVGAFELGGAGEPERELVCSSEPCAMCFGAIPWSGVRRVVCGARDTDAAEIGFDEGPKPSDWAAELRNRGIEVVQDLRREEAIAVLQHYRKSGGVIYNGRLG